MRGRFNIFQCAMLRWREPDPYNAVHAVMLPDVLDRDRLAQAIEGHLTAWGIAQVSLDPARQCYEYRGTPDAIDLQVLPGGADPDATLAAEMQRQLNLPFPRSGIFVPFRFFAVTTTESFRLGVAYDHVFAGGDSIVALLKGVASRYAGKAEAALPPPELYPPTYRQLLRGQVGAFLCTASSLLAMVARVRRCVRPRYPFGDGRETAFVQLRLTNADTANIRRCAKAWSVTVNDLMLAVLLKILDGQVAGRESAGRRNEIAIASVINIRNVVAPGPAEVFGQFLSSFMVSHRVPPGISVAALARDIQVQVDRVKRRKLYLLTLWAIAVGGFTWRALTPEHRNRMYARNYPVWAGMTTLYVDPIWQATPGDAPISEYVRGVSTGPFAPLVMAPATADGRMTIGLTFRTAAFRPEDIARLHAALLAVVRELE